MKLDERDSIIIDTLLDCGMDNRIAKNPDAVKETLEIVNKFLHGEDVKKLKSEGMLQFCLEKIVSDSGSIVYTESKQNHQYCKGKDGKDTLDCIHTFENKTTITVDFLNDNITSIYRENRHFIGYGERDLLNFPDSLDSDRTLTAQYPMGCTRGIEYINNEVSILENGIETEYTNSTRNQKIIDKYQIELLGNHKDAIHKDALELLEPYIDIEHGEIGLRDNYSEPEYRLFKDEKTNYGFGIPPHEGIVAIYDTGSTYTLRRSDISPDIIKCYVSQNKLTPMDYIFNINAQRMDKVVGLDPYYHDEVKMPDQICESAELRGFRPNGYTLNYNDYYIAKNELFTKSVERYAVDNDTLTASNNIELSPELKKFVAIKEGIEQPETVELEDLSKYKQTKPEISQDENRTITFTDDSERAFFDSISSTADKTYKKSYDMVKKEPNILKRMLNFIKEKFRGKNQTKDAKNNNDLEL